MLRNIAASAFGEIVDQLIGFANIVLIGFIGLLQTEGIEIRGLGRLTGFLAHTRLLCERQFSSAISCWMTILQPSPLHGLGQNMSPLLFIPHQKAVGFLRFGGGGIRRADGFDRLRGESRFRRSGRREDRG